MSADVEMGTDAVLRAVDAVTVPVPDLDQGLACYRDGLGHELIWRNDEMHGPANDGLGRELDGRPLLADYVAHRSELAHRTRCEARIVIDCANGSGGVVAPEILRASGASVDVRFNEPDGSNINLDCGATAPGQLAEAVAATGADLGFALDGDADRCVAVDERGQVVDGDPEGPVGVGGHATGQGPLATDEQRRVGGLPRHDLDAPPVAQVDASAHQRPAGERRRRLRAADPASGTAGEDDADGRRVPSARLPRAHTDRGPCP